jgi:hypothetical protein
MRELGFSNVGKGLFVLKFRIYTHTQYIYIYIENVSLITYLIPVIIIRVQTHKIHRAWNEVVELGWKMKIRKPFTHTHTHTHSSSVISGCSCFTDYVFEIRFCSVGNIIQLGVLLN